MADEDRARAIREYFTACFLAISTSFAGLATSGGTVGRGFWVIVILALTMVAFVYFQIKQQGDGEDEAHPISHPRLKRMAILWYVLSIALGAALVKDLVQTIDSAETKTWLLSVIGLGVSLFAITRLIKIFSWKRG